MSSRSGTVPGRPPAADAVGHRAASGVLEAHREQRRAEDLGQGRQIEDRLDVGRRGVGGARQPAEGEAAADAVGVADLDDRAGRRAGRERRADHGLDGGDAGGERGGIGHERSRRDHAGAGDGVRDGGTSGATISATRDGHGGADERVPGPRDRRRPPDREHGRDAGHHPREHGVAADRRPQRADQERAEHRAGRQAEHGEAGVEDVLRHVLGGERHRHLHEAPAERGDARHAEEVRVVGVRPDVGPVEVVDGGGGERVDRRRQRRGDDGRDDQAGEARARGCGGRRPRRSCRRDRPAPAAASAGRRPTASRRSAGTARTGRTRPGRWRRRPTPRRRATAPRAGAARRTDRCPARRGSGPSRRSARTTACRSCADSRRDR